jgi:tyrosine-protein kinase Etk/Wzc
MIESNNSSTEEEKVGNSFFDFITVTVRYRKFLFWLVLSSTLISTGYALLSPKWYKATASVFPAEKTDFLSAMSGLSSLVKNFSGARSLAALTGNTETDRYIAILQSSTVVDDVVKTFHLKEVYGKQDDWYENVIKEYTSNVDIKVQDEGNLTVSVFDKSPIRAALIANYLIDKLNKINTDLSVTNAKANRQFVEKRYFQNVNDINALEDGMKSFQEKFGVIAVPEQIEATVKSMSNIYVDIYKKDVELNVLKQTYGEDHPLTKNTKIELNELQKKIDHLNAGTDVSQKDVSMLIPFKHAPQLANEYLKIYRNLEIQYKILEFIQPLYEQAKIEEVRNTPSVLVLDKAAPPERKAKPKGTLYAIVAFVISLGLGLFIVYTIELFSKFRKSSDSNYNYVVSALKSDFSFLYRRKKV